MNIQTATIRRLRDALLQSGRRAEAVQSSAFEALARAGILSEEEQAALKRVDPMAETMFLMMAADGKITAAERDAMRGAIRGLTANLLHEGTIQVMIETYEKTLAAEGREARLKAIGAQLAGHVSDAEGAFALAAAVALADDDVDQEEQDLVEQLASWFGITPTRAEQLLDQLEEDKDK
ncbi:MAG TPA: TerB family tellurite resistance protein [Polyangiaceae bacterium]|nr:TerB family tellurite resistance protein [Polyangiaceae bacterium]